MDELPGTAVERVASQIRAEVFRLSPRGKPIGVLTGTVRRARDMGISQTVINQALAVPRLEGLISTARGSGTTILARQRWQIEVEARRGEGKPGNGPDPDAPGGLAGTIAASVSGLEHPAITVKAAEETKDGRVRLVLVVESERLDGALAAAMPVARRAFGPLKIVRQSAEEAEAPL